VAEPAISRERESAVTTKDGRFTARERMELVAFLIIWVFWEAVWVYGFPQFGGTSLRGTTLRAFFLLPWSFFYALFFWALFCTRSATTARQQNGTAVTNGRAR
jgi:hypothetical protein